MQKTTPILPGIHLQTLRKKPRTAQQKLADNLALVKQKHFSQLGEVFGPFIPKKLLERASSGVNSRRRLYSKENTFWTFLGQVLSEDGGCREVVTKLQAYAALKGLSIPSSNTASYCEARGRLNEPELRESFKRTSEQTDQTAGDMRKLNRRVIVVDGTGLSMPDTASNQEHWPQQHQQKQGCGFPSARITGCFSLETGALLSYALGNKHQHELALFRQQWEVFRRGDILLADKGYCSYYDIAKLQQRGVDSLVTLARRTPVHEAKALKQLGKDDYLITWKQPKRIKGFSISEERAHLPKQLLLREIKVTIKQSGFRTQSFYLVTTLTDPDRHSAEQLSDIYFQRWDVELFLRDIKCTMGMDLLRCQSSEMIRKEILMNFIAYNCIRRIMYEAAKGIEVQVRLVSFKGSLQTLRNWEPHLNQTRISTKEKVRLIAQLHLSIAQNILCLRPGRVEPRAIKRRPKNYQLLTRPRKEMNVSKHRCRAYKTQRKEGLS